MAPPEHLMIGVTVANIAYSFMGFFKRIRIPYGVLIIVLVLASVFPDIDSFFGHYTSPDPWVGHRGMTHSFLGVAVSGLGLTIFGALLITAGRLVSGYWKKWISFFKRRDIGEDDGFGYIRYTADPFTPRKFGVLFFFAFLAGVSHLMVDLPQPPSVWKGLPLLFPLKEGGQYVRHGGWAYMGWYDIKVIWVLAGTVLVTTPLVMFNRLMQVFRLKFIAYSLMTGVILFNIYVFIWMKDYIVSCEYKSTRQWYVYQNKVIKDLPEKLKHLSKKGRVMAVDVFRQVRRYH